MSYQQGTYVFNRYERLTRQVLVYKDPDSMNWEYMLGRSQLAMFYPAFWPRPGR